MQSGFPLVDVSKFLIASGLRNLNISFNIRKVGNYAKHRFRLRIPDIGVFDSDIIRGLITSLDKGFWEYNINIKDFPLTPERGMPSINRKQP